MSWNENGPFTHLPVGCPPPIISPPPKPDPCQMGYEVGEVISTTIANIIVPQIMETDPNNPYAEEPLFKEIKKLEAEYRGTNVHKFNDTQEKFLRQYAKMVLDFANKKLNCFSEKIIPVEKLDITFICTDQSSHSTIEEALRHALGDQITCHHINCNAIQTALDQGSESESAHLKRIIQAGDDIVTEVDRDESNIIPKRLFPKGEDEESVELDFYGSAKRVRKNGRYYMYNVNALIHDAPALIR